MMVAGSTGFASLAEWRYGHPNGRLAVIPSRQARNRNHPGRGRFPPDPGIQNPGGRLHERHERACLPSRSTGTSLLTTSRNEKRGTAARDATIASGVLFITCSDCVRFIPVPFYSARRAMTREWRGGMPSMPLMPLMQNHSSVLDAGTTAQIPPTASPSTRMTAIPRYARNDTSPYRDDRDPSLRRWRSSGQALRSE
jgi:hypothetical protein